MANIIIKKHDGAWTTGTVGAYKFEIKHFEKPSEWGIDDGRISKLDIRMPGAAIPVAAYDRGWDVLPISDEQIEVTQAIIDKFN